MTEETIISTPAVETGVELLRECVATRSLGVIVGNNGCGKTFALRAMEGRYPKMGLPGKCLRYRCCQATGVTRGVRDIIVHLGGRGAGFTNGATGSLQLFCKFALAEFKKRDIQTLLLDEADLWDVPALSGLVTLFDFAREQDHPVTVVMTGVEATMRWIEAVASGRSRTLRIETIEPLPRDVLLAVLREWAPPFSRLADEVNAGTKTAVRLMDRIHRGCDGNLRRSRQFTDLILMQGPEVKLTEDLIRATFGKMLDTPHTRDS
jgi:hypothetical protein